MKKYFYIIGTISTLLLIILTVSTYQMAKTFISAGTEFTINNIVLPTLPWLIFWLLISTLSFAKFKYTKYITATAAIYILITTMAELKITINALNSFELTPLMNEMTLTYDILKIAFCFFAILFLIKSKPWKKSV